MIRYLMDDFINRFNNLNITELSDDTQLDNLINDLAKLEINDDNKITVNYLFECLYSLKTKKRCVEFNAIYVPTYIC